MSGQKVLAGAATAAGLATMAGFASDSNAIGHMAERVGVPFVVLLMLAWAIKWCMENLAKPLANKHNEFIDTTIKNQAAMTACYERLEGHVSVISTNQERMAQRLDELGAESTQPPETRILSRAPSTQ